MNNKQNGKNKKNNKRVSIGGQAVLEGVMMRGEKSVATAVRDEDGVIRLETARVKSVKEKNLFFRLPIVRGACSFFSSLVTGTSYLMRSAEVYGESEPSKFEKWLSEKFKINIMSVVAGLSMLIGLALAVALFILAPQYLRIWILGKKSNPWAKNFFEGGLKLLIFIAYITLCSLMKDVRRTFMYHGAEHKTITCYERGMELTPENAKICPRVHDRCGTTFIVFVMVISIIVFACFESILSANGVVLKSGIRAICKIALLPVVAGLSYELLKALAKTTCPVFYPIKLPGLLLQKITTREPDSKMLEVAITAFKTVLEMDADASIPTRKFVTAEKRSEILKKVSEKLKAAGIDEDAEAEWIISITLGIKRDEVNSDKLVSPKNVEKINALVNERLTGRPLWYCVGDTDFYGYKIKVDERVLIPRPETELLVLNALKDVKAESCVLDLCTGSGAIAVAIEKQTGANVVASDVSCDALALAKENAELNGAKVEFIESDMFSQLGDKRFDVIVSNPPYITVADMEKLQKEVKDFEPRLALDGGEDGLEFYRIIAENAEKYLKKDGKLFLEVGINQAQAVADMLKNYQTEIIKDYENVDRIVKAVLSV